MTEESKIIFTIGLLVGLIGGICAAMMADVMVIHHFYVCAQKDVEATKE